MSNSYIFRNVSFTLRRCGSGCDFRTPGDGDVANVICSLIGPKAAEVCFFESRLTSFRLFQRQLFFILILLQSPIVLGLDKS